MTREPKNLLLLGATFDTGNLGVSALAAGAVTIAHRRFADVRVSLLDYGHRPTTSTLEVDGRHIDLPLVNLRFSWKLWLPNNIAALLLLACLCRLLGKGTSNALARRNRWVRAVHDADAALAISGGDSFSDIYGLGRFMYIALPQLLVMAIGKPLVVLPQTIGPFKGRTSRWIAQMILRYATLTCSRDEAGLAELKSLLGADAAALKARFCNDIAFVIEPRAPKNADVDGAKLASRDTTRPLVGLNVSGLLLMGGYSKDNMFGLTLDYANLVERLVDLFIIQNNTDVLLVPHVFSHDAECDVAAARKVHDKLERLYPGRLFNVHGQHDQNEIKHVIGQCEFFVGSRMHACIAALSQCIPAVGIAYSDKFAGVFDSAGVGHMVVDPRRMSADQILASVSDTFDQRVACQSQLRERMQSVRRNVFAVLDDVAVSLPSRTQGESTTARSTGVAQ
jgi:colanic acid/amylovoran biosynthesis protein